MKKPSWDTVDKTVCDSLEILLFLSAVCACVCVCMYMRVCMRVCMCACMHMCVCAYTTLCACFCMWAHVCVCISLSLLQTSFHELTFSKTGTARVMRSQNRTDTSWSNADLTSSSPVGDWHSLTSRGISVKRHTDISFPTASLLLSFTILGEIQELKWAKTIRKLKNQPLQKQFFLHII